VLDAELALPARSCSRTKAAVAISLRRVSYWVLESVRESRDRLTIRLSGDAEWTVEFAAPGLKAEHRIWERYGGDRLDLADFFAGLNDEWRGWKGEKTWEAQGLLLTATHDGMGHVRIVATLDDASRTGREDAWAASLRLFVDAGQLDVIARSAQSLSQS
jgi:Family of unknown function (DUF6228)